MVMLTIIKRFLLYTLRNRGSLVSMIVLPLVFTLLFGVLPTHTIRVQPIAVVDEDHSAVSKAFIDKLKSSKDYSPSVVASAKAQAGLRDLTYALVVTLPSGMQQDVIDGKPLHVSITPSPNANRDASGTADLVNGLRTKFTAWSTAGAMATATTPAPQSDVVQRFIQGMSDATKILPLVTTTTHTLAQGAIEKNDLTTSQSSLLGFATMFIIFTVFSSTGNVFREKLAGTWGRLKASPASHRSIILGYGASFFLLGWLQFLIMYGGGRLFFHIALPMNAWLVLTVSLYILTISGLALCIAGVVKSIEQHMSIGSLTAIATSMIGGAYWPIDVEPSWMQHLAWFTPQNWALSAFKTVALGGAGFDALMWPIAVMLAFAVVFFSVGMVQLRYS